MKTLASLSLSLLAVTATACLDNDDDNIDSTEQQQAEGADVPMSDTTVEPTQEETEPTFPANTPPPIEPLATDACDEPTYAGVAWQSFSTQHFVLQYLPGTTAATEREIIGARLEAAYADIRSSLALTAEPIITVTLSPSRTAAAAHGKSFGRAVPSGNRYEVVYTGAANSYEVQRYGQLLTVVLDYHIDATKRTRHPFFSTGVSELLDQSGRDLHVSYAQQMLAGIESRVRVAELDSKDINGRNPGRSGSFVQFLADRYGAATFANIYRATAVTWNSTSSCYTYTGLGCISTPEQLATMIDTVLKNTVNESYATVQAAWKADVESALVATPTGSSLSFSSDIHNLLRVVDHAISNDDVAEYRSTLEGFYCEWGGEDGRNQLSSRAVTNYGTSTSELLGLYETGTKNFTTALGFVKRTDNHGQMTFHTVNFEQVPAGWRISYSPDWY